jgi:hypothetical protein
MKIITQRLLSSVTLFSITAGFAVSASAAVVAFEFETAGDTEGWSATTAPANALVTGFTATTDVDGNVGVLTSSGIDIDPQITRNGVGNVIALPVGDVWSSVEIRFRQLSADPQSGGDGAAYAITGQILFFNGTLDNRTPGPSGISTQTYAGTGGSAADSYAMTVVQEDAVDFWQVMTLDLSSAPTLAGGNITGVRFDPIGNNAAGNFEVDYIRFTSVPEPSSLLLSLLGAGLIFRRRR